METKGQPVSGLSFGAPQENNSFEGYLLYQPSVDNHLWVILHESYLWSAIDPSWRPLRGHWGTITSYYFSKENVTTGRLNFIPLSVRAKRSLLLPQEKPECFLTFHFYSPILNLLPWLSTYDRWIALLSPPPSLHYSLPRWNLVSTFMYFNLFIFSLRTFWLLKFQSRTNSICQIRGVNFCYS